MNLYQIMIRHYAPKDSTNGIYCYLVTGSDEQVYEWLKEENRADDEIDTLFLSWEDREAYTDQYDENYEDFKKNIIRDRDEENDYADYEDLYYGRTFVSWKLVKEDVKPDNLQIIKDYGVRIFNGG